MIVPQAKTALEVVIVGYDTIYSLDSGSCIDSYVTRNSEPVRLFKSHSQMSSDIKSRDWWYGSSTGLRPARSPCYYLGIGPKSACPSLQLITGTEYLGDRTNLHHVGLVVDGSWCRNSSIA